MSWIKGKGPGGGKLKPLRVNRTWLIRTVKAQQRRINYLEQAIMEEKATRGQVFQNSMPSPSELAPLPSSIQVSPVQEGICVSN